MDAHKFREICQVLKIETQQVIAGYRLTQEFTGSLDLRSALNKEEKCWLKYSETILPAKKTVILAGWYFKYLNEPERNFILDLLYEMIDADIPLLISDSQGLIPIKEKDTLLSVLNHFNPLARRAAIELAAEKGIKQDSLVILDSRTLATTLEFQKLISSSIWKEIKTKERHLAFSSIKLPYLLSSQIIHDIEDALEPEDELHVLANLVTLALLPTVPKLCEQVRSIKFISGPPICLDKIDVIFTHCKNIKTIDLSSNNLPESIMKKIYEHHPFAQIYSDRLPPDIALRHSPNTERPLNYSRHFVRSILDISPNAIEKYSDFVVTPNEEMAFLSGETLTPDVIYKELCRLKPETGKTYFWASKSNGLSESLLNRPDWIKNDSNPLQNICYCDVSCTDLSAESLDYLLKNAGHMTDLDITRCENLTVASQTAYVEQKEKNYRLTSLNANKSALTSEQLSSILINHPVLSFLDISYCNNIISETLDLSPGQLPYLTELVLFGPSADFGLLKKFLEAAPNIEALTTNLPFSEIPWDFQPLKLAKLIINSASSASRYIKNFFQSPNLSELSVLNSKLSFDEPLISPKQKLTRLTSIQLSMSSISANPFANLIQAAPNLRNLDVVFSTLVEHETFIQKTLPTNSLKIIILRSLEAPSAFVQNLLTDLKELHTLNLSSLTSSSSDFSRYLSVTPNLVDLSLDSITMQDKRAFSLPQHALEQLTCLTASKSSITGVQLQSILDRAPNVIEVKYGNPIRNLPAQSLPLCGRFENDPKTQIPTRLLFQGTAKALPVEPSTYHLNAWRWMAERGCLQPYQPDSAHLLDLKPDVMLDIQTLLEKFKNDSHNEHYRGQIEFGALQAGFWYLLPATSTHDELIHFASSLPSREKPRLVHDEQSGYHFVQVDAAIDQPVFFTYVIHSGQVTNELRACRPQQNIQDALRAARFNTVGKLKEECPVIESLKTKSPRVLAGELENLCSFKKNSAQNLPNGTPPYEILNTSLQNLAGACRHRAQLFVALADVLGLKSLYINNDCHAFVTVQLDTGPVTISLGGAPGLRNIGTFDITLATRYRARTMPRQKTELVSALPEAARKPGAHNPFQIWNSLPLETKTPTALISEAMIKCQTLQRLLLVTQTTDALESLHLALVNEETWRDTCFYTACLDDIALKTACVNASGEALEAPSALAGFIQQAINRPNDVFYWFINWSDAEARHSALNCLIDTQSPRVEDQSLPDNLKVMVLIDKASFGNMGEEFHSRLRHRSQIPPLPAPPTPPCPLKVPEADDLVLINGGDYEKYLLGNYRVEGQRYMFIPGRLLSAEGHLTIHNPPWHNAGFRTLIRSLACGRVYCNGDWHTLAPGLNVDFASTQCVFPEDVFELSTLPDVEIPLVLNESTWELFFSMTQIRDEGLFSEKSLLEYGPLLRLYVTDELSELKWYWLVKQAQSLGVKLLVVPAPHVKLPEALTRVCSPQTPEPLQAPPFLRILLSNDLDYALSTLPVNPDHVVPINLDTHFESLMVRMERDQAGRWKGGDSDLLNALLAGKHVVLKGRFSQELMQKMHSIFTPGGTLIINARCVTLPNTSSLTLITDTHTPFEHLPLEEQTCDWRTSIQHLNEGLQQRLSSCYQSLKTKPCFSHLATCPLDPTLQLAWVERLEQTLHLAAGLPMALDLPPVSSSSTPASSANETETNPQTVLDYLYGDNKKPFVYLISETGAGKTHLMRQLLPEQAKKNGEPIHLCNGMQNLKEWLTYKEGKTILFIDEANISNEDYHVFDNLARGEPVVWYEGKAYHIPDGHKIVFAGNPEGYGGRMKADLFHRFPYYLTFNPSPLAKILKPLLSERYFDNPSRVLSLIQTWYGAAQTARLNITPRNALMMCQNAYALKLKHPQFPEQLLLSYAVLGQLKALHADSKKTKTLRREMKQALQDEDALWTSQGLALKDALRRELPQLSSGNWIWTPSREKLAITVLGFLHLRELRMNSAFDNIQGLNGFLLEGMPGLGKSAMLKKLLEEKQIPYLIIPVNDPAQARARLLQACREGKVALMDELNSFPDERLLNDLLSGLDPENPENKPNPGFAVFATQNPASFKKKDILSKALDNRFMTLSIKEYTKEELQIIMRDCFQLKPDNATKLIKQWDKARVYARQKGLLEPDTRTLFEQAQQVGNDKKESRSP